MRIAFVLFHIPASPEVDVVVIGMTSYHDIIPYDFSSNV